MKSLWFFSQTWRIRIAFRFSGILNQYSSLGWVRSHFMTNDYKTSRVHILILARSTALHVICIHPPFDFCLADHGVTGRRVTWFGWPCKKSLSEIASVTRWLLQGRHVQLSKRQHAWSNHALYGVLVRPVWICSVYIGCCGLNSSSRLIPLSHVGSVHRSPAWSEHRHLWCM